MRRRRSLNSNQDWPDKDCSRCRGGACKKDAPSLAEREGQLEQNGKLPHDKRQPLGRSQRRDPCVLLSARHCLFLVSMRKKKPVAISEAYCSRCGLILPVPKPVFPSGDPPPTTGCTLVFSGREMWITRRSAT